MDKTNNELQTLIQYYKDQHMAINSIIDTLSRQKNELYKERETKMKELLNYREPNINEHVGCVSCLNCESTNAYFPKFHCELMNFEIASNMLFMICDAWRR